jgi:hypothetical protein
MCADWKLVRQERENISLTTPLPICSWQKVFFFCDESLLVLKAPHRTWRLVCSLYCSTKGRLAGTFFFRVPSRFPCRALMSRSFSDNRTNGCLVRSLDESSSKCCAAFSNAPFTDVPTGVIDFGAWTASVRTHLLQSTKEDLYTNLFHLSR